ncbi:hypothetical protein PQX77_011870 [Marasmius sp. AFHP31]|nr:hypothetical protein PQX77_011870 [Marasmius sp. AFHP31]
MSGSQENTMNITSIPIAAFRPKPPVRIDFDRFDTNSEEALSALVKASKAIGNVDDHAACRDLSTHWSRVWPWFRSFARAVLRQEQPKTSAGFNSLVEFIDSASNIVIHPTFPFAFKPELVFQTMNPILKSTPEVVALTFELWLYASQMDLAQSRSLLHSIGVLFDAHASHEMPPVRRFTGGVLSQLEKVLGNRRWDVPGTFVKELIRVLSASLAEMDYLSLWYLVLFPNALIRSTKTLPLPSWNAKDAIRWISLLLRKLLSSPRDGFDYRERQDITITCAVECMSYIEYCAIANAYFLIPALDEGVLLSFMKARDLLIRDAERVNPVPMMTLTYHFCMICKLLLFRMLHRPISVRLSHCIKKIGEAGLDVDDISFTVAPLNKFRTAWTELKNEVLRRSSVQERYGPTLRICESLKCTNLGGGFDLKTSATHSFMRCSGCQSSVYCSEGCQKDAWVDGHRYACRAIQQNIKGGTYPRTPGMLEMRFAQHQLTADYEGLEDRVRQLRREYAVRHPNEKDAPIPWLDYRFNLPPDVSVCSLPESRRRLKDFSQDIRATMDLRSAVALAVVHWRGVDRDGDYIVRI